MKKVKSLSLIGSSALYEFQDLSSKFGGFMIELLNTKERKQKKIEKYACQRDSIHCDIDCASKGAVDFVLTICCFFINQRCSSENDCAPNFCCPILLHRCLPKILENGACNFNVSTSLRAMLNNYNYLGVTYVNSS